MVTTLIGRSVPRVEDDRLVRGRGEFTINLPEANTAGALHVGFVRSPVGSGRILDCDGRRALRLPGCVGVYFSEDIGPLAQPPALGLVDPRFAQPLLASGTVRYAGEPVAVVAATTAAALEDVIDEVDLRIEPSDGVTDLGAALRDERALFPDIGTNLVCRWGSERFDQELFAGCDVVIRADIRNQRIAPVPLETRAAVARWNQDDLTIWQPTQGVQQSRRQIATMLKIDEAHVRVVTRDVGGAFGAKHSDPEHALVAWVSRQLGTTTIWSAHRSDDLTGMTHGRGQRQSVCLGGTASGRLQAYRLDVIQDCGAYPKFAAIAARTTLQMALGAYAFDRAEARARCVVTNTTPVAAYRGSGRPEAASAIERAIDMYASRIGADPVAIRQQNMLPRFTMPLTNALGTVYDSGDYRAALARAVDAVAYGACRQRQAERRRAGAINEVGIGIASYVEGTGSNLLGEDGRLVVQPDVTVDAFTGTSPHGQGHETVWATLISDRLGIPLEAVRVHYGDTALIPTGVGTFGSRSLQIGGVALLQAADDLLDVARRRASNRLECDNHDVTYDRSRRAFIVRGDPESAVTLAKIVAEGELAASAHFESHGQSYTFGTVIAVVEVDVETGKVNIDTLVAVDDAGTIVNPMIAEGQIHGGLAQGISQALFEHVVYDAAANPLTASLATYTIPSAADLPHFDTAMTCTPSPYNPMGAKGIGESGTIGSAVAIQNAVIDALGQRGVSHIDLPLTPARVWAALRDVAARRPRGADADESTSASHEAIRAVHTGMPATASGDGHRAPGARRLLGLGRPNQSNEDHGEKVSSL